MSFHTTTRITDNLYRIAEPIGIIAPQFGVTTVNMYLVVGNACAALIDSGMGIGDIRAEIRKITALPVSVLNSHYHWDHSGANALFEESAIHESEVDLLAQEPEMSAYRRAMEQPDVRAILPPDFDPAAYRIPRKPPTRILRDGDVMALGGRALQVIHTPGHSPGHVAYFDEASGALFTADTAYCGPMYACFAGSDPAAFAHSARRLSALRGVKMLCPGHNDIVSNAGFLAELADAMDAALSGRAQSEPPNEMLKRKEFRFGEFSVWFPM
ncbi:MAG: MBL fold metallo-hydrolase [Chloroflexi bacterium]|nr:MBL fold metallo-hydrolase [Chloroflexota bacterium]